jgi:hypothetical protein
MEFPVEYDFGVFVFLLYGTILILVMIPGLETSKKNRALTLQNTGRSHVTEDAEE